MAGRYSTCCWAAIAISAVQTHYGLVYFCGRLVDRFVSLESQALEGMLAIRAFADGTPVWLLEDRNRGKDFADQS